MAIFEITVFKMWFPTHANIFFKKGFQHMQVISEGDPTICPHTIAFIIKQKEGSNPIPMKLSSVHELYLFYHKVFSILKRLFSRSQPSALLVTIRSINMNMNEENRTKEIS